MNSPQYALKKKFVDSLFADDWETLASTVHPDFELHEPNGLPYAGVWKGAEGFKACWKKIREGTLITEHLETVRTYFAEDPNHLTDLLSVRGKIRANGKPFEALVFEQWEIKDDKIHRIRIYWDNLPDFAPNAN